MSYLTPDRNDTVNRSQFDKESARRRHTRLSSIQAALLTTATATVFLLALATQLHGFQPEAGSTWGWTYEQLDAQDYSPIKPGKYGYPPLVQPGTLDPAWSGHEWQNSNWTGYQDQYMNILSPNVSPGIAGGPVPLAKWFSTMTYPATESKDPTPYTRSLGGDAVTYSGDLDRLYFGSDLAAGPLTFKCQPWGLFLGGSPSMFTDPRGPSYTEHGMPACFDGHPPYMMTPNLSAMFPQSDPEHSFAGEMGQTSDFAPGTISPSLQNYPIQISFSVEGHRDNPPEWGYHYVSPFAENATVSRISEHGARDISIDWNCNSTAAPPVTATIGRGLPFVWLTMAPTVANANITGLWNLQNAINDLQNVSIAENVWSNDDSSTIVLKVTSYGRQQYSADNPNTSYVQSTEYYAAFASGETTIDTKNVYAFGGPGGSHPTDALVATPKTPGVEWNLCVGMLPSNYSDTGGFIDDADNTPTDEWFSAVTTMMQTAALAEVEGTSLTPSLNNNVVTCENKVELGGTGTDFFQSILPHDWRDLDAASQGLLATVNGNQLAYKTIRGPAKCITSTTYTTERNFIAPLAFLPSEQDTDYEMPGDSPDDDGYTYGHTMQKLTHFYGMLSNPDNKDLLNENGNCIASCLRYETDSNTYGVGIGTYICAKDAVMAYHWANQNGSYPMQAQNINSMLAYVDARMNLWTSTSSSGSPFPPSTMCDANGQAGPNQNGTTRAAFLKFESPNAASTSAYWKTLIGYPAGYGSNVGNDHHFHYGYWLNALYLRKMLGKSIDPTSTTLNQWDDVANEMILDVANWTPKQGTTTLTYPMLQYFDPWEGHSWANGYGGTNMANGGTDQESVAEALHFYAGMYFWADLQLQSQDRDDAIDYAGMKTYAAYLFTSESRTRDLYWFNNEQDAWDPTTFTLDNALNMPAADYGPENDLLNGLPDRKIPFIAVVKGFQSKFSILWAAGNYNCTEVTSLATPLLAFGINRLSLPGHDTQDFTKRDSDWDWAKTADDVIYDNWQSGGGGTQLGTINMTAFDDWSAAWAATLSGSSHTKDDATMAYQSEVVLGNIKRAMGDSEFGCVRDRLAGGMDRQTNVGFGHVTLLEAAYGYANRDKMGLPVKGLTASANREDIDFLYYAYDRTADAGQTRRTYIVLNHGQLAENDVVTFSDGGTVDIGSILVGHHTNTRDHSCQSDVDGSGLVDIEDLLSVIAAYGACGDDCENDFTGQDGQSDGQVDTFEILMVIGQWGLCNN
ncbi:MAG: hypothetical protein MK116_04205 [Phycisphaerales bacterium]|nr:hypothetical protein [Phycisphaerales bacterium]